MISHRLAFKMRIAEADQGKGGRSSHGTHQGQRTGDQGSRTRRTRLSEGGSAKDLSLSPSRRTDERICASSTAHGHSARDGTNNTRDQRRRPR